MPLATKNGSFIVKSGSIAEDCNCCASGWYCDVSGGGGACCEGTTCSIKPQCDCQGAGQVFKGVGTVCVNGRCPCPGENFLCQAPGCRPRFVTVSIEARFQQDVVQYGSSYIRFPAFTFSGTITLDNTKTLFPFQTPRTDEYVGRFFGADAAAINASETRIVFYAGQQRAILSLFRKIESLTFLAFDPCGGRTGVSDYQDVASTSTNTASEDQYINYVAFPLFGTTLGFSATGHCYGTGSSTEAEMNQGTFDLSALSMTCAERGSTGAQILGSVVKRSEAARNNVTWTFIDSYT